MKNKIEWFPFFRPSQSCRLTHLCFLSHIFNQNKNKGKKRDGEKTKVSVWHGNCVRAMFVQLFSLAMGVELQPPEVVLQIPPTHQLSGAILRNIEFLPLWKRLWTHDNRLTPWEYYLLIHSSLKIIMKQLSDSISKIYIKLPLYKRNILKFI